MIRYRGDVVYTSPHLMNQLHQRGKDILDAFVDLCEQHGLRYYLAAGTLLGAVRHQGPIPWDDDVDVYMPRPDADAFVKFMMAQPGNEIYHIQCYTNEPTFLHFNYHMNMRGTLFRTSVAERMKRRYMELWMDIFPMDEHCETSSLFQRLRARYIRSFKREIEFKGQLALSKPTLKHRLAQIPFSQMSVEELWNYTDQLMRRDNLRDCECYASWTEAHPFPKNVMPKSWFEPASELSYMGSQYRAPCAWNEVLTQLYGDYMQLPPESKRKGHSPLEVGF